MLRSVGGKARPDCVVPEGAQAWEGRMSRLSLLVALAPLAVVAACAPKPAPPPAPVMTGPEAACAARGATTAGVDVSTVTVMPTASTKAGDTI